MKEKILSIIFFLSFSISFAQITDYQKTIPPDLNFQDRQSIDVYCTSKIVEVSEDSKLPTKSRQQFVVDKIVELFRTYIPNAKPEYGKKDLPSTYNGKISLNAKEEMQKFLSRTESDFIFIVYNITSSDDPYTGSSPGGYWYTNTNSKVKMSFELWNAKTETIMLDFEIEDSGNTSIDDTLFKAVEFVKNKEKANRH